jgi:RES domain-containing protein
MQGWRITKQKYSGTAFNGEGASLKGGRWNSQDVQMVYASSTLSLATLEILARYGRISSFLKNYVAIPFNFDKELFLELEKNDLPNDWKSNPPSTSTQLIGDYWTKQQASVILGVPSSTVPVENNFLINPAHPDFKKIETLKPELINFDSRLFSCSALT